MTPIKDLHQVTDEDVDWLRDRSVEAETFLLSHKWCDRIVNGWFDRSWPGLLAVFFFELVPTEGSFADKRVWVIVGDVPPAYIDISQCPNGACAIDGYVGAMREWARHVKEGKSVENDIPVNAPATLKYARMLERRLKFMDREIFPQYKDELES